MASGGDPRGAGRPWGDGRESIACSLWPSPRRRRWPRRPGADRLFAFFAAAFAVMGANGVALGLTDPDNEFRVVFYAVRLLAFGLILAGILDKNRAPRR